MTVLKWVARTGKFQSGFSGCSKRLPLFSIYWDASIPKGTTQRWALSTGLPGLSSMLGCFEDVEDAKNAAQSVWEQWLTDAGVH